MRFWVSLLWVSLAACGPTGGGPSSPSGPARAATTVPPATNRVERWQYDIDQLVSELSERHVDPFARVSRETFESEALALRSGVPELEDPAIVAGMMRLVALLGDAQTALDIRTYGELRQLPVELVWLSDGIFVARATEKFRDAVGGRLVRIGDGPVDDAVAALKPLVAHENEPRLRVVLVELLRLPEILQATGVVSEGAEVEIEVALSGSEQETLELELRAAPAGPLELGPEPEPDSMPLYRRNVDLEHWLEPVEDAKALYVHCRRASEAFGAFAEELLAKLDDGSIHTLVLDLRANDEGDSAHFEPLLSGLESRPQWSAGEGVYVVIGARTFSSGVAAALELKRRVGATLVGEPTGGKPNHFGDVRSFLLNESRLRVSYSSRAFRLVEDGDPASLEPDVAAAISSADYFAGRDPALELIFDRTRR